MIKAINPLTLCILSGLYSISIQPVLAEQNEHATSLERITVRGALVQTPLSEMASSISVIGAREIDQRQAEHLEHILNRAANVNFSAGASRGRFFQIRGIGERSQFVDPINPSVGFLVDGINYSGIAAGASTFDVAQVEIFKGPNSARFGADGLAGMINVVSADAGSQSSVNVEGGVADYDSWDLGVAAGGAIADNANVRWSAHKVKSDGFITNTFLEREDTNGVDEFTSRLKVDLIVSDDWFLSGVAHHIDVDNGYDAFSLNRDRTTLSDEPGFDRQKSNALAATLRYQGFDWGTVQLQATQLNADLGYGYDEDWSYVGIAPYDPINDPDGYFAEYSSTDHYFRDRNDNTVELKLYGDTSGHNRWVVGAYFADREEALLRNFFDWGAWADASFTSDIERQNSALFGLYRASLSDDSWFVISGRVANQQLDYVDSNGVARESDDTDWGAELSYHHQASDNSMVYVKAMRSYKMGGVNGEALGKLTSPDLEAFRDTLLQNATFSPESLLGTEFGVKGTSEDGSLSVQVAAFYQWRDDIQYKSWFVQDQSFVGFYNNAVDGTNYGLEADINWMMSDSVAMFASVGWLETDIDGITRQGKTVTIDNRDQAHAPTYQANVGLEFTPVESVSWLVEMDVKDDFYFSYSHDEQSGTYALVHTNLTYSQDNWQVSLYARNVFDREYATRGFYFGNDPRDGYEAHNYIQRGEPRRVGIAFKYQY